MPEARLISLTSLFTALVCVFTMFFQLHIPATRGYFNLGEVMVYTAALVGGPWVGGFAGGVGSMLADVFTGYVHFAPATLVIKGVEGTVVGLLVRVAKFKSLRAWRTISLSLAVLVSILILSISPYYVGEASLGFPPLTLAGYELIPSMTLSFTIPPSFWLFLAAIAFISITYAGFKISPECGWVGLSILCGGALMVLGYFLYELVFMGVAAFVEVPFNIAQVLIGLMVSLPLYQGLRRSGVLIT